MIPIGHVKDIFNALLGPEGGVFQTLGSEQEHPASLTPGFFEKSRAFVVAGKTEQC